MEDYGREEGSNMRTLRKYSSGGTIDDGDSGSRTSCLLIAGVGAGFSNVRFRVVL